MTDAVSRRQFLAGFAGAVTVGGAATGSVSASHLDQKPASVSLTFEEDYEALERYKPYLVTDHLDYQPNALYAWHASSADYSTSLCCYWAVYDVQRGVLPFSAGHPLSDSHRGDHEPIYCEYDKATGELVGVYYSAYHWLKGVAFPSDGLSTADGTRPLMWAIYPHHQTRITTQQGSDIELKSLLEPTSEYPTTFEKWLEADDMEASLGVGTMTNPWTMSAPGGRPHWWRLGSNDYSFNAALVRTAARVSALPGVDWGSWGKSDPVVSQS